MLEPLASIIASGKQTLQIEANALTQLANRLDESFAAAVRCILNAKGRVAVSGVGKSALIAAKIAATFNSTGTPAMFLHAGDAVHGDLGMLQPGDVIILISKSGSTEDIRTLIPLLHNIPIPVIGITGNLNGYLAKAADIVLDATVEAEADPNGLAPTTSTTAALAMGDALAVALIELRGFTDQDFARYHPGGSLGKRLYLKVVDVMRRPAPTVSADTAVRDVIVTITEGRVGAAVIVNAAHQPIGIITDGDLRRMLAKPLPPDGLQTITARQIASLSPITITADALAMEALKMMEKYKIAQLPVVGNNSQLAGILHFHDLLAQGLT
jgi:arabinose-5-phosphate isomerase